MQLKVISPEKTLLDLAVDLVELPASAGRFQVLEGHAPTVTSLTAGTLWYVPAGERPDRLQRPGVAVSGGFAEVRKNVITVCVE